MGEGGWTGDMALSTRLQTMIHAMDLEAPADDDEKQSGPLFATAQCGPSRATRY